MAKETIHCPNCNTEIKDGFISNVNLLLSQRIETINRYSENKQAGYCTKCSGELFKQSGIKLKNEHYDTVNAIAKLIGNIIIVTTHSPYNWEYEIPDIVTGQSTTGTGVVSELTSSFTDLFGIQSNRYNNKIKAGETLCASQIRKQALDLGGNAIIATDIDYAELGAEKGMIMVCMAGTAVKVTNPLVLGAEKIERISELRELTKKEKEINTLLPYIEP